MLHEECQLCDVEERVKEVMKELRSKILRRGG